jgi:hypothetical protein
MEPSYEPHHDNYFYNTPSKGRMPVQMDWDKMNPTLKNAISYWHGHDCTLRFVSELFDVSLSQLEYITNYLRTVDSTRFPAKTPHLKYHKDVNLFKLFCLRQFYKLGLPDIKKFTGINTWTIENILKRYSMYVKIDIESLDDLAEEIMVIEPIDRFAEVIYNLYEYDGQYTCEFGSATDLISIIDKTIPLSDDILFSEKL